MNTVWTWCHWKTKKRTIWSSVWSRPTMCHTFGHQAVCATSKDAKIVQIWNQRNCKPIFIIFIDHCLSNYFFFVETDGSGHHLAKRSNQQTDFQPVGDTIHGVKQDTRNCHNQTTLNTISIKPPNHVCQCWTTCTTMALHGTMLLAITKNQLSAKIPTSYWTT